MKWLLLILLLLVPASSKAAVGYDNSAFTAFGASPRTISFTVGANTDRALFACVGTLNDTAQAPTYNGVAFTDAGVKSTYPGAGRFGYHLYYLINPATGANTFSSGSSAGSVESVVGSYYGVDQTTPLDQTNVVNQGSASPDITTTITTTVANDWMAMCEVDSGAGAGPSFTAGANTTIRATDTGFAGSWSDSNGPRSTGSNSVNVSMDGSVDPSFSSAIGWGIRPSAQPAAAFNPYYFWDF